MWWKHALKNAAGNVDQLFPYKYTTSNGDEKSVGEGENLGEGRVERNR